MGLFTYTIAGGGFILIGAWESFVSSSECIQNTPLSPPLTSPRAISAINNSSTQTKKAPLSSSSVTCISISVLSFFFILNSLIFISDALNSKDHVGFAFQLEECGNAEGYCSSACIRSQWLWYSLTSSKNEERKSAKSVSLSYSSIREGGKGVMEGSKGAQN
ncbi:unnamed protein product [Coffea canephora]|uniref:Uncharacterized protein n=1 Tax=Coffea canephora TaxID=49390 RepID=A0A068UBD9_COFCA|nr:unnamed protein product [Coffea canephora]